MKNLYLTFLYILISLPASYSAYAREFTAEEKIAVNAFLIKIASRVNKNAPMQVDRAIILKNATVEETTLIYNYKIDMVELQKISKELYGTNISKPEIETGLRMSAIKDDCSAPDDPFFKIGASIGRYYYDDTKNLIFKVVTTKSDCIVSR
jgi:hypothetical protein